MGKFFSKNYYNIQCYFILYKIIYTVVSPIKINFFYYFPNNFFTKKLELNAFTTPQS